MFSSGREKSFESSGKKHLLVDDNYYIYILHRREYTLREKDSEYSVDHEA